MEMRQSVVTMPSRQGGATQANDRKETGLCDHAAVMRQASIGTANTGRRRRKAEMTPGISASARPQAARTREKSSSSAACYEAARFRRKAASRERKSPRSPATCRPDRLAASRIVWIKTGVFMHTSNQDSSLQTRRGQSPSEWRCGGSPVPEKEEAGASCFPVPVQDVWAAA